MPVFIVADYWYQKPDSCDAGTGRIDAAIFWILSVLTFFNAIPANLSIPATFVELYSAYRNHSKTFQQTPGIYDYTTYSHKHFMTNGAAHSRANLLTANLSPQNPNNL